MLDLSTQIDASEWLKKGNILIHPNEGVWGIGCDALNKKSCLLYTSDAADE